MTYFVTHSLIGQCFGHNNVIANHSTSDSICQRTGGFLASVSTADQLEYVKGLMMKGKIFDDNLSWIANGECFGQKLQNIVRATLWTRFHLVFNKGTATQIVLCSNLTSCRSRIHILTVVDD